MRAKALSHLSAKWPWVGAELRALHGPDVHALRLSYGRPGEELPAREDIVAQALADAEEAVAEGMWTPSGPISAELATARERAYSVVGRIDLPGGHHRSDIALRAAEGSIEVPAG